MASASRHLALRVTLSAVLVASVAVFLPTATHAAAEACELKAKEGLEPPAKMLRNPLQEGTVDPDLKKRTWMSAQGKHLHVWWWKSHNKPGRATAENIICNIESKVWPKYSQIMSLDEPLNDGKARDPGPNSKIDIAIIPDAGLGVTGLEGTDSITGKPTSSDASTRAILDACKSGPSYVLIRQKTEEAFSKVLAHELFHAFQYWKDAAGGCIFGNQRAGIEPAIWLAESTAEWAAHYVYPNAAHEFAATYLDHPEISIFDESDAARPYASYLLFLHALKKGGHGLMTKVWDLRARQKGMNQLQVVDEAVSGGWQEIWKKFVAENFFDTAGLTDSYLKTWKAGKASGLALKRGAKLGPEQEVSVGDPPVKFPEEVAPLAARYWVLTFPDADTRKVKVRNLNGSDNAAVQVFEKPQGKAWKEPVQLDGDDSFCRPEKLVIAVSNSSTTQTLSKEAVQVEATCEACGGSRIQAPEQQSCGGLTGTLQYTRTWDESSTSGGFLYNHQWDGTLDVRLQEGEFGGWDDDGTAYSLQGSGTSMYSTSLCTVDTTTTWSGSGMDAPTTFLQESKFNLRMFVEVDGVDQNSYSGELCSGSDTTEHHDFWVVECSNGVMTVDPTTGQLIVTFGPELDAEHSVDVGNLHGDETQNCSGELKTEIPPPEG